MTGHSDATATVPTPDDIRVLFDHIGGYRVSQAIYMVIELGIADLLRDGPVAVESLAEASGADAEALYRVLRFLAGAGLFEELASRQFIATRQGHALLKDVLGSPGATTSMRAPSASCNSIARATPVSARRCVLRATRRRRA